MKDTMNTYKKDISGGLTTAAIMLLILIFSAGTLRAKKVDVGRATTIAQHFIQSQAEVRIKSAGNVSLKHAVTQPRLRSGVQQPQSGDGAADSLYYIFNIDGDDHKGFVIVSGNDATRPILGYSDNGVYDENNLPPNFAYWLGLLKQELASATENDLLPSAEVEAEWQSLDFIRKDYYSSGQYLVQTKWAQGTPFNNLCPLVSGTRSPAGCVATVMAQIMKYYNHPAQTTTAIPGYVTDTRGLTIPAQSVATYDWNNMANSYTGSTTTAQKNAVATLTYHCGVSVKMDYTATESGANALNTYLALRNYFGYSASLAARSSYTDANWIALLKGQIDQEMPVYYSGQGNDGGHAFVCDGYNSSNYVHFNWGWSGSYDGWFPLSSVGAGGYSFYEGQVIIYNIKPDRATSDATLSNLTVSRGSLQPSFSSEITNYTVDVSSDVSSITLTATANYTGATVTGDGVKTLRAGNNVFNIVVRSADRAFSKTYTVTVIRYDNAPLTTPFTAGFESATTGWVFVNGSQTNKWVVGTATAASGSRSAYISNNGTANAYTLAATSRVHLFCDVAFTSPANAGYELSFDWKGMGEKSSGGTFYDYMEIHLVETSDMPEAGDYYSATPLGRYTGSSTWQHVTLTLPASHAGTTKRLVFTWRNDASGGTQPPVAIDNVSVTPIVIEELTVPFTAGFESATTGWGFVNGLQTNKWVVGTATAASGSKSAYISNNGTANAYTLTVTNRVHLFCDVAFSVPTNNGYELSFDWKGMGETIRETFYDYMEIHVVETSDMPEAGDYYSATPLARYSGSSTWQHVSLTLPASYARTTKRLVFTWRNDASGGTQPPVAIDNVSVTPILKSNDATLKSLTVNGGTFTPAFNANTTNYSMHVLYDVTSITVTGLANHSAATVSGNGTKQLNTGNNVISLTVMAEDGTTVRTYKISVDRDDHVLVTEANLNSLMINGETVQANDLNYAADCNTASIHVNNLYASAYATVTINGFPFRDGDAVMFDMTEDITTLNIRITAETGGAQNSYTLKIISPIEGSDLYINRWNNVLAINRNTANNGGIAVSGIRWYGPDGVLLPSGKDYIRTESRQDEYYAEIMTGGEWRRVCRTSSDSRSAESIQAYPNPVTRGSLTLQLPEPFIGGTAAIYDINGTAVRTALPLPEKINSIDISALNSGIYLIRITGKNNVIETVKIIKE
jgi:hypothetical protein